MSDPSNTSWASAMPAPSGVVKAAPDLAKMIATRAAGSPNYQALKGQQSDIEPGSATEKLAAFNKGLYGSLPFGIGEKLLQFVNPKAYEDMQTAAEKNPGIATAGSIGGSVAQGIEAPALGAGKLAGVATTGVANILGRNALNSAVAAAPNAITKAAGGDIGGAAKDFAINTGIGTAVGSAAEGIANKLPDILNGLKEWGQRRGIGAAGINGRDLKGALRSGPLGKYKGTVINNADDEVNALWTSLKQTGAFGTQAQKQLFGDQGEVWEQLANGYNQAGIKLTDPAVSMGIFADPKIQEILGRTDIGDPAQIGQTVHDVISGIDAGATYNAKKKIADEIIKRGRAPNVDAGTFAKGQIAGIVKQNIDDIAGTLSPQLDVAGMKYDYHTLQPLFKALEREKMKIPANEAGSATAARQFTKELIGGGEGGAGGLLFGAATTNPDDPDRWGKILRSSVGGVVLGGAGNKVLASMVNKIGGRVAGGLSDLLTPAMIQTASNSAQAIAPQISRIVGELPTPTGQGNILQGPTMQPAPAFGQAPQPPQQPDGSQPTTVPMMPIPNAPAQPPAPTPIDNMNKAQDSFVNPTAQKAPGFDPNLLNQRLDEWYEVHNRKFADGMSPQDFASQLSQATNGFSPDNPLTYKIMVDDPAEADRLFKAHQTMKKLDGVHLEDALNYYTHPLARVGGTRWGTDEGRAQDMAHTQLVSALHGMGLGDSKEIEARLKKIAWDPKMKDDDKRSAVTDWIANEGGVPIKELVDLGLWH
jgi:hypothetical protein